MLTQSGCIERRQRLWDRIPEDIEWLLIGDPRHVQYLTGFRINPVSFSADQRCAALLERSGSTTLLADNFARRSATMPFFVDNEILTPWYTHRKSVINRDHALAQAVSEARNRWSGRTGLIEPEGLPEMLAAEVAEDAAWQFCRDEDAPPETLGSVLRSLRRNKHADEIALLELCMRAGEAGHLRAFDVISPGVTEFQVYLEVQKAAQEAAGQPCIVYGDFRATNNRLHKAGGLPTSYALQDGDLFILDYSVVIHGYRSDFTNTISVGAPAPAVLARFEACRDALNAAAAALTPGMPCRQIWKIASDLLESRGFGSLAHHAGHGLGLEHPEPPILVSESEDSLMVGDVITLEPGCYTEGVGGMRFEHNYEITESGSRQLSQHQIALQK